MLPDPTESHDVDCPKTLVDSEAFPVLSSAPVASGKRILCARRQEDTSHINMRKEKHSTSRNW